MSFTNSISITSKGSLSSLSQAADTITRSFTIQCSPKLLPLTDRNLVNYFLTITVATPVVVATVTFHLSRYFQYTKTRNPDIINNFK